MSVRAQTLDLLSTVFPGHNRDLDMKWNNWKFNAYTYRMTIMQAEA